MAIDAQRNPLDRPAARPAIGAMPVGKPMLIDRLMPTYDAVRAEHRIVPGDVATAYVATRRADFIRAWRESAALRLLFAARGLGERAVALAARREFREPPAPESMRLADMPTHGDWVLLGEDGFGRIACNFSLRSYGADRTLVTYECRTLATDSAARRGFMRYWRPLAPFIGLVMRSQLHVVEAESDGR
jgi:hypothetical protein